MGMDEKKGVWQSVMLEMDESTFEGGFGWELEWRWIRARKLRQYNLLLASLSELVIFMHFVGIHFFVHSQS